MNNWIIKTTLLSLFLVYSALGFSEIHRDSVSKEEVNGTFIMKFPAPHNDLSNTLTVRALGSGKINISFNLIYPYEVNGELQANTGELSGIAHIKGDTAVYSSSEYGQCTITLTFIKPGMLSVKQEGSDADCGLGHNVYADGTYYKKQK
ncbi:hypothetical protein [Legionella resiliens]|uniref:Lipocalin-like domain-containing protein n=1 Tax=Legionella resiliens TaxID=2905958 RepID=A0ABS8WYW3_9GAMM|nr:MULTISPECIES: hypothetical protein [unclassified Legionella]MCE0721745.1 hypothetical protein [Legionella sp. 9fVS26]MCE3530899.1 hypothetical protein [Legionella sp. 8cVS16]